MLIPTFSTLLFWDVSLWKVTFRGRFFSNLTRLDGGGESVLTSEQWNIIISVYKPTNVHIISHKLHLKHFKTLPHVSILSHHHHQGALFLAKVMLQYSQFNSYLQTRYYGSVSCCVGMCCGAVARWASYAQHLCYTMIQYRLPVQDPWKNNVNVSLYIITFA